MNPTEQKLLEELKRSLAEPLQREIVDSYIATTTAEAVLTPLLKFLNEEISRNEAS
jgi:ribosome-binding factor A